QVQDHLHVAGIARAEHLHGAVGRQVAPQLGGHRGAAVDPDRIEDEIRRLAQLEAAARQQRGRAARKEQAALHTTTFTRRPGTTTTFFGVAPPPNFAKPSLASAMRSISALSAPAGTRMEPRILPLTCSTSSTSSWRSADSSTCGQGASSRSPWACT